MDLGTTEGSGTEFTAAGTVDGNGSRVAIGVQMGDFECLALRNGGDGADGILEEGHGR